MRCMFIVNPAAGGRKNSAVKQEKLIHRLNEALQSQNKFHYDLYITQKPGDAVNASGKAAENGYRVIVAVGGDGTVNEVANGMAGSDAALATIPTGKGNDFAAILNMPRSLKEAIEALSSGCIKSIDLGRVLERYFVNSLGVGFDAAVASRVNGKKFLINKGKWPYISSIFSTFLTYQPVEMEMVLDDTTVECKPTLVAVGIGHSYGGGIKIVPTAVNDDGFFDICVIDRISKGELLYYLPRAVKGKHLTLNKCKMYRSKEIVLNAASELPLHMEGEVLTGRRMHFTLQHKGIKVLTAARPPVH